MLRVTDPALHDRFFSIGLVGELVVESSTIALEYLNDTEKTEAAFMKSSQARSSSMST